MTVNELFTYANTNHMLNVDVNKVIASYHRDHQPKVQTIESSKFGDKVEWTFEEVMALFST